MVKEIVKARFDLLIAGEKSYDDLKVFVKQEAHSDSKISEGRFRLISAVSLIDTLIDRILFGWLGRKVLQTVGSTPCLVGWSPVRGGWIQLVDKFRGKATVCLDRAAWDWTVQGYLVDIWIDILKELAMGHSPWWLSLVKLRFKFLFDEAVFRFEDGTRVVQQAKGIMKSGCYLTIILNSLSQSVLHYLTNIRCGWPVAENEPFTIGDDTVQYEVRDLEKYVEVMENLGPVLKGAKVRHFVEFAGFAFTDRACWPAYWKKHLFNMAHSSNLAETLFNYQYLYVHEPVMYSFVCRVAREVGPEAMLPRILARDIMDMSR